MLGNWWNDNAHRSFPLVDDQVVLPLPDSALVDFGCLIGPGSGFISGVHRVYLGRIERFGSTFRFLFRTNAPGLAGRSLVFSRVLTTEYVASQEDLWVSESSECVHLPVWSGFLVTGNLQPLADLLSDGDAWEAPSGTMGVEPELVQDLSNAWVQGISLVNAPRPRSLPPEGCGSSFSSEFPEQVVARCLEGDIVFVEGYNAAIRQNQYENALILGAAVGAGAGEVCSEISEGDDPWRLRCDEIIQRINGVSGRHIRLYPGQGIRLEEPGGNVLRVVADLKELAICLESSQSV